MVSVAELWLVHFGQEHAPEGFRWLKSAEVPVSRCSECLEGVQSAVGGYSILCIRSNMCPVVFKSLLLAHVVRGPLH